MGWPVAVAGARELGIGIAAVAVVRTCAPHICTHVPH